MRCRLVTTVAYGLSATGGLLCCPASASAANGSKRTEFATGCFPVALYNFIVRVTDWEADSYVGTRKTGTRKSTDVYR